MRSHLLIAVGFLCATLCTANLLQAAIIGWWEFDEGTGDTAFNSVVGGDDGQIGNHLTGGLATDGSVWVNDPVRESVISFNGAADGAYVFAGTLPTMTLEQDFTWGFWANNMTDPDTTADQNSIVVGNRRLEDGSDPDPREFIKFTRRQFEYHRNGAGENLAYPADMPVDQWQHHAVVKDGTTLTYYRDGLEASTREITEPLSDNQPTPLFFGGDNTARNGENWIGLLDDVRIFDNALTAEEVAELLLPPFIADPGDVNIDGVVNSSDLIDLRSNYFDAVEGTKEERWREGDLNGDRIVDFFDYRIWKDNYVPPAGASAAVPEPAGVGLALLGAVVLCGIRRRV